MKELFANYFARQNVQYPENFGRCRMFFIRPVKIGQRTSGPLSVSWRGAPVTPHSTIRLPRIRFRPRPGVTVSRVGIRQDTRAGKQTPPLEILAHGRGLEDKTRNWLGSNS